MLQFSPALPISGPGARHASALDLFPLPDLVRLLGTMWPTDRLEGWQPSLAEAPEPAPPPVAPPAAPQAPGSGIAAAVQRAQVKADERAARERD
jgi:hypothetical protein